MYAPRGFGLSEVGDVEVIPVADKLHLFHLTLPNHDLVQHAVSNDGLAWQAVSHALRTGDPGACDDDQIWTMSVTEREGGYFMVYTALGRAEDGLVQRTALAASTDLRLWTKHSRNPVAQADPRWYEADLSVCGRISWRDPKPIKVGDTYYATVCAREKSGPLMRRGCVGLMASPDLVRWEVRPPLFAPRRWWDLECPQAFVLDGTYYLTAAVMEDRSQRYWMAKRFEGPYEVPPDGGILAPQGHYAGRVCHWQGLDLFYCWHRADYDWPGFRNPFGKLVPPPLALFRRPDGSLGRRSYPGWERYRLAPLSAPAPMLASLFRATPTAAGSTWAASADGGMDVLATREEASDFWLEGQITLDAPVGGLALRLDEQGGGYFVELKAGREEVSLQKWLPASGPDLRPWFRWTELQRGRLPRLLERGEALAFRLLVVGPYIECSLGGEVVLATVSAERSQGRVGLWAESGAALGTGLAWAPMKEPEHG